MIERLDVDGDGKVTLTEIEQHRAKQFSLMDRNNDGKLEGRELRRGDRDGRKFERHGRQNEHGGKHWKRHGKPGDRNGGERMPDRT